MTFHGVVPALSSRDVAAAADHVAAHVGTRKPAALDHDGNLLEFSCWR